MSNVVMKKFFKDGQWVDFNPKVNLSLVEKFIFLEVNEEKVFLCGANCISSHLALIQFSYMLKINRKDFTVIGFGEMKNLLVDSWKNDDGDLTDPAICYFILNILGNPSMSTDAAYQIKNEKYR
jgi:hypothetical protein